MATFKNELSYQEYVYDFSEDGGVAAANIVLSAKAGKSPLPVGAIVKSVTAWVEAACTSVGAATVSWGHSTADGYSGTTIAVASLTLNAVFNGWDNAASLLFDDTNDHPIYFRVADAATGAFNVLISTEALNAGRIVFMVEYYNPA